MSEQGDIYELVKIATTSYVDTIASSQPTSVSTARLIDADLTDWKQDKVELDGHGRPIRTITFAQGSAPADEIKTFVYRADGTIASVSVPDPTANNSSLVTFTYSFDSLGRPTSIRRPDSTTAADQSGADVTYAGLTQTTTEHGGAAGGQEAVTKTVSDAFGRLIEVHEKRLPVVDGFAITHYAYGPDDIVKEVRDPENVTTVLSHDLAGRRTKIERAGRAWQYGYDKNGNLQSELAPYAGTPSAALNLAYTTTTVYDNLDRPSSRAIATRDLSTADQALFGSRTETFEYDFCCNRKSRLSFWKTFAPSTNTPTIQDAYGYDAQGNTRSTTQTLIIAGFPTLSKTIKTEANLLGARTWTSYADFVGGTKQTKSRIFYDKRGLPRKVDLLYTDGSTIDSSLQLLAQTRNVAGLVTKGHTDLTGPMTFIESNWTYDKLHRVTSQVIQKGPGPVQVAQEALAYFGTDDPSSLTHAAGGTTRRFQYSYDLRHQVTSAIEVNTPGYFAGSYSYGLAGRLTSVTEQQVATPAPIGSEIRSRRVDYEYAGQDPEQVTGLLSISAPIQQRFSTYSYDPTGNQKTRCYGASATPCTGESTEYTYDGHDRLRRAKKLQTSVVVGSEEYWYGTGGERIAVMARNAAGLPTGLKWFFADSEAHYDATGAATKAYSHIALGTPVARVERTSNTATKVELVFHGLAGSTLASVQDDGTTNAVFTYSPLGEVVETTSTNAQTSRRRFNDKYVDETTGLSYYGARYYDPILATWLQADPKYRFAPDAALWKNPRRTLLYAFSLNNALSYLDPDGLEPWYAKAFNTVVSAAGNSTFQGARDTVNSINNASAEPVERPSTRALAMQEIHNASYATGEGISRALISRSDSAATTLFAAEAIVALASTDDPHEQAAGFNAAFQNWAGNASHSSTFGMTSAPPGSRPPPSSRRAVRQPNARAPTVRQASKDTPTKKKGRRAAVAQRCNGPNSLCSGEGPAIYEDHTNPPHELCGTCLERLTGDKIGTVKGDHD